MAIGDVTSNERGSGARYNDGKPDMSLIPLSLVAQGYLASFPPVSDEGCLAQSLVHLGRWQTTGKVGYLHSAMRLVQFAWHDCARVLEYGRNKYAAWNWAKGMVWSATLACAGRHALRVLHFREPTDDESGLPHIGHYLANLVMLATFVESYPEGNDLPPPEFFRPQLQGKRATLAIVDEHHPMHHATLIQN